jgi:hypothetical protein
MIGIMMGGGWNAENQNIERSEHQKFFKMIRTLKVKKITTSKVFRMIRTLKVKKITTSKV